MLPITDENLIYCNKDCGPIFGNGHDLCLTDKCNVNNCYSNFPDTYMSRRKYKEGQSSKLFTGSTNYEFKVK